MHSQMKETSECPVREPRLGGQTGCSSDPCEPLTGSVNLHESCRDSDLLPPGGAKICGGEIPPSIFQYTGGVELGCLGCPTPSLLAMAARGGFSFFLFFFFNFFKRLFIFETERDRS